MALPHPLTYFFSVLILGLFTLQSNAKTKNTDNNKPSDYYLFIVDFSSNSDQPALVGFYNLTLSAEDDSNESLSLSQQLAIPYKFLNTIVKKLSVKPIACALTNLREEPENEETAEAVFCLSRTMNPLLSLLGLRQTYQPAAILQNETFSGGSGGSGWPSNQKDIDSLLSSGGSGGDDDDTLFPPFAPGSEKSLFDMPELMLDTYLLIGWLSEKLRQVASTETFSMSWLWTSAHKPGSQVFCSSLSDEQKKCSLWLNEFEPAPQSIINSIIPTKRDYINHLYQHPEVITLYPLYSLPEGASPSLRERDDIAYIGSPCTLCRKEFTESDQVILSPCHHLFHQDCLTQLNHCTECSGDLSSLHPYLNIDKPQEDTLSERLTSYLRGTKNLASKVSKTATAAGKLMKVRKYTKKLKQKNPSDTDIKEFVDFLLNGLTKEQTQNIERVIEGTPLKSSSPTKETEAKKALVIPLDSAPFRETDGWLGSMKSAVIKDRSLREVKAEREISETDTDLSEPYNQIEITNLLKRKNKAMLKEGPDTPAFRLHNMMQRIAFLNPFSNLLIGTYITFRLVDEGVTKSVAVTKNGLDKITRQAFNAEFYTEDMGRHLLIEFQSHQQLTEFLLSPSPDFVINIQSLHGISAEELEQFKAEITDLFGAHYVPLSSAYLRAPVVKDNHPADYSDKQADGAEQ